MVANGIFISSFKYDTALISVLDSCSKVEELHNQEFGRLSNLVSRHLCNLYLRNETVGIVIDREIYHPVLIAGVLKAGAAFISLPSKSPIHFLRTLIDKEQIRVLLYAEHSLTTELLRALDRYSYETQSIDNTPLKALRLLDIVGVKNDCDFAYVITTSGSTGSHKFVRVPFGCIMPNVQYFREKFAVTNSDVIVQASPWTFDPSIINLLLALSTGAKLLLLSDSVRMNPTAFVDALVKHKATILQATPSLLLSLPVLLCRTQLFHSQSTIRCLALGGEACPSAATLQRIREAGCPTRIFNLYGITEVSCWASCYEISPTEIAASDMQSWPLGLPLPDTQLIILDSNGHSADEGLLYIGGENRVCHIDDELALPAPGTLRCSGDIVRRSSDDHLYYEGRRDDQCKRHGQRMNLSALQQIVVQDESVQNAAALLNDEKLWIFVSLPISMEGTELSHEQESIRHDTKGNECIGTLKRRIRTHIHQSLPSQYFPDEVFILSTIPVTTNGKLNKTKLLEIGKEATVRRKRKMLTFDDVSRLLKTILHSESVDLSKTFLEIGGNSFMLLNFLNTLECTTSIHLDGNNFQQFLTAPLQKAIYELLSIKKEKSLPYSTDSEHVVTKNKKELPESINVELNGTQLLENRSCQLQNDFMPWMSVQRTGLIYCSETYLELNQQMTNKGISNSLNYKKPFQFKLSLKWKFDSGKCIDAAPLYCCYSDRSSALRKEIVVIGSHSHRLAAMEVGSGDVLWDTTLGDRIESSPCLSACGQYVVVGCYGGYVYAVSITTGKIFWSFPTSDIVKCSPCLDPITGLVIIGSHDHNLYALNIGEKRCLWRRCIDSGSIFSSPAISLNPHLVVCATCKGTVMACTPTCGSEVWRHQFSKPVFSSPRVLSATSGLKGHVFVGCADAAFYCLCLRTGQVIWRMETGAPIFSSPCVTQDNQFVIENKDLRGQNPRDSMHWKCKHVELQPSHMACNRPHDNDVKGQTDERAEIANIGESCEPKLVTPRDEIFVTPDENSSGTECHNTFKGNISLVHSCLDFDSTPEFRTMQSDSHTDCRVIFGSHDHCIYCVAHTGDLKWKFQADSPVYSSPFVSRLKLKGTYELDNNKSFANDETRDEKCPVFEIAGYSNDSSNCDTEKVTDSLGIVVACSTFGSLYILSSDTGKCLAKITLPFEIFSSPIVVGNNIFIGCRDNHLYCIEIKV